jgi:cell division protein FtsB
MALFWDLLQQHQIGQQSSRSGSLEERIEDLERESTVQRQILEKMARQLDEMHTEESNG